MKYNFENVIALAPADWDNDLMSLSDDLKDLAVYSWLRAHPSWIEDYIPEACFESGELFIEVLYRNAQSFRGLFESLQLIYADKENISMEEHEDVFYHCAAFGDTKRLHFNAVVGSDSDSLSFADWYRDAIYLSIEDTLRDKLLSAQGLCEA